MIAIYARQSIDKKDSLSIDGQIALCKKECGDSPYKVYKDKGYSGKNTNRPDFQKMMKFVKTGEVEKIIVYRLDRISRSITDFGTIWEILHENGAEFVSVNEKFDTSTPVGRAMVYIIMVFAQLERETTAERVKDSYYQRVKRGAHGGGTAAFGFDLKRVEIGGKKTSIQIPNSDAETVKWAFQTYANTNASLGKIAKMLTEKGASSSRNRECWDNVSLSRILHNPIYVQADADIYHFLQRKGAIIYNDITEYTGEHAAQIFGRRPHNVAKFTVLEGQLAVLSQTPGLIDSSTFLHCQQKLDENRQIRKCGTSSYSWLTGVLKCAACGYAMRAVRSTWDDHGHIKEYFTFNCSGRQNMHVCDAPHKRNKIADIEAYISDQVAKKISSIRDIPPETDRGKSVNAEKIELEQIDRQIEKLLDAITAASSVSMKYINDRLRKLDERKKDLLAEIEKNKIDERPNIPKEDFHDLPFDEKKRVIRALVERILLSDDKITIEWAF